MTRLMENNVNPTGANLRSSDGLGTERARGSFVVNVCSNLAYIGAQTVTTLWLTPFLIGYLGIAAFGITSLANSIVSYMSILTTALYSAVS